MALSVTYTGATYRIVVPQSDLTLVSGSLYEHDTDAFWDELKAWEANVTGIVFQDMQSHNPDYTVGGVTYAPKVEVLNATNSSNTDVYEIFYSPDTSYAVRLTGSNNNLFDKENAILANANVQVLGQNSAGLIIHSTGSGLDAGQDAKLTRIHTLLDTIEGALDHQEVMRILLAAMAGKVSGMDTLSPAFRDSTDSKNRITAITDADGNRTSVALDAS